MRFGRAMAETSIAFETKVWEQDYRQVLTSERLEEAIGRNMHDFDQRTVFVNNVDHPSSVMRRADRLVDRGLLDAVVLVQDHADAALTHFGLTREALGRGYVYSISELVGLYLSNSEYVLHFAGDTVLAAPYEWLPAALSMMEARPEVAVANVSWTATTEAVRSECTAEDGQFLLGQGFSDQMYLVRAKEFKSGIYGETNPASERYPAYGGDLFEKRVDAWMRNHGRLRATWIGGHYVHQNIRRPPTVRARFRSRIQR